MYSGLYETEREEKIKSYSDLKDERNRLNDMANILGRERRKIKDLKAELQRKEQIIMELVEKAPDPWFIFVFTKKKELFINLDKC